MITRFAITDRAKTGFAPFIDRKIITKPVEFKSGVNVVVGAAGSGKSSLLFFLASLLHCTTGRQEITQKSCDLVQRGLPRETIEGFEFEHNGAPCVYYNPDNYKNGPQHISRLFGQVPKPLDLKNEKRNILKSYLVGDGTAQDREATYLIDSPETGMSLEQLINFGGQLGEFDYYSKNIDGYVSSVQVIVATEHPFLTSLRGVNIVELSENYFFKIKSMQNKIMQKILDN